MKRTNVLQALIFSIVILFGGTACDNANDDLQKNLLSKAMQAP